MSLINDVKEEIQILTIDKKNLRKFGIMIGGIFIGISLVLFLNNIEGAVFWIFVVTGGGLFIFGITAPVLLSKVYLLWMASAIVMGWFVSRLILIILFYIVITPIGFIAKLAGKTFLDVKFKNRKDSYWILKTDGAKNRYDKMY